MELLEPCFIRKVSRLASAAVFDPPNPPKCSSIPWDCSAGLELDLREGLLPPCIPSSYIPCTGHRHPPWGRMGCPMGMARALSWGSGEVLTVLHPIVRAPKSVFIFGVDWLHLRFFPLPFTCLRCLIESWGCSELQIPRRVPSPGLCVTV